MLVKAAKRAAAIAILQQRINDNPYPKRLYQTLAAIYMTEKQYEDALRVIRRELELFPEDAGHDRFRILRTA